MKNRYCEEDFITKNGVHIYEGHRRWVAEYRYGVHYLITCKNIAHLESVTGISHKELQLEHFALLAKIFKNCDDIYDKDSGFRGIDFTNITDTDVLLKYTNYNSKQLKQLNVEMCDKYKWRWPEEKYGPQFIYQNNKIIK